MTNFDPQTMACNRCATTLDLRGLPKGEAVRQHYIMPASYHSESDCIRHLAKAISEKEQGSTMHDWRYI